LKASGKLNAVPAPGTTEEASNSTAKVTESAAGVVFAEPFEVTDSGMKLFFRRAKEEEMFHENIREMIG
jgi:hypothetical protein